MAETPPTAEQSSESSGDPSEVSGLAGRVIDERYRLERYLGGGGMGEVYRAEHTLMHKTVAVKLLRPEVAQDESIIERFRREAAAAANLEHPNICAATDFGKTEDGFFYLVMEYVDGRSLQDLIDERGALPVDEVVAITDGIAAALEKADELDVVHRDIKPDNVMLVDRGDAQPDVKVLDFGVAHVEFNDQMPSLTKTGAVFGTPTYMSPEQATGDTVGHRSDLYGLGVVMFEMLTGREIFEGQESAKLMAAHITEQPDSPSEVRPEGRIPPDLNRLVMELLAKQPEGRPDSASAVRARLQPFRSEPDGAAAASQPTPVARDGDDGSDGPSPLVETTQKLREWTDELDLDLDDLPGGTFNLALLALAGLLGLAFVGLVVASLALLLSSSPDEIRASLDSERATYKEKSEVAEAVEPLENGRPADAVDELEALREERGSSSSAHLHFLLGRAYTEIGNETEALNAFREAGRTRSNYLYDETILDALEGALTSRDSSLVEAAREFVGEFSGHAAVQNRVARLAWKPESERTRKRAYETLTEHGLMDDIPEWQRLSIKLRRADDCEGYKRYISALEHLGDPRGAEMIRIYDDKPRRGCGRILKLRDCYKCVREDIDRALETLEE